MTRSEVEATTAAIREARRLLVLHTKRPAKRQKQIWRCRRYLMRKLDALEGLIWDELD